MPYSSKSYKKKFIPIITISDYRKKIIGYTEQKNISTEDLDGFLEDIPQVYLYDATYDSAELTIFQTMQ